MKPKRYLQYLRRNGRHEQVQCFEEINNLDARDVEINAAAHIGNDWYACVLHDGKGNILDRMEKEETE